MNQESMTMAPDMREFLTTLFREKRLIILVSLLVFIAAAVLAFFITPMYEGSSTLLVKIGREYIYQPDVGTGSIPTESVDRTQVVEGEIQILRSREIAQEVIKDIGLAKLFPDIEKNAKKSDMPPMDAAVLEFANRLVAAQVEKSNVVQVTFDHEDPKMAALATNKIVEKYQARRLAILNTPKSAFLANQVEAFRQQLRKSENDIESFKRDNGIFSFDDQRRLLLQQRDAVSTSLREANNDAVALQERITALTNLLKNVSETVVLSTQSQRYEAVDNAKQQLLNLQLQEQQLLAKYNDNNPAVKNIRNEIKMVQGFLEAQRSDTTKDVQTGTNQVHQQLQSDLLTAKSQMTGVEEKRTLLAQQEKQLSADLEKLDESGKQLQVLQRNREVNEKTYLTYVEKLEEARINDDMDQQKLASVRVIQAASVPQIPVGPRRLFILLGGALLAGLCGLGAAFGSNYFRDTFSTPTRLERQLRLPVLATVGVKR